MNKFLIVIFLILCNYCPAQDPSYTLRAMNFSYPEPNAFEFDVYIESTNPSVPFKYVAGQFAFDIDTAFFNGGKISFNFPPAASGDSSDVPVSFRPRDAIISKDGNDKIYFRMTSIPDFAMPEGLDLTGKPSPGVKITRVRFSTSADKFSGAPLDIKWRNGPDDIFTKIFVYDGKISVDVTNPENHLMILDASDPGK